MKLTVLEDASPYYMRFQHAGIDLVRRACLEYLPDFSTPGLFHRSGDHPGFCHYRLDPAQARNVLSLVPFSQIFDFQVGRVSLFITEPGYYYRAHKDGLDNRISINYPILVQDQACRTHWYGDEDLEDYPISNLSNLSSRECEGFDPGRHEPIKSMTAAQGEALLFNTDIFHDFDNSSSPHHRVVLTLRLRQPGRSRLYFDAARRAIINRLV